MVAVALAVACSSAMAVPYAKQAKCMADNLHHEARGESLAGIKAVANVVMNRVASKRYPNTICKVVYQRKQFSWANGLVAQPVRVAYTAKVMKVVAMVVAGRLKDNTKKATHYHTKAVKPYWAKHKTRTVVIGFHIFYRKKQR